MCQTFLIRKSKKGRPGSEIPFYCWLNTVLYKSGNA